MTEEEVIELYDALCANEVAIWIDGGWCVDALLGVQTSDHRSTSRPPARCSGRC